MRRTHEAFHVEMMAIHDKALEIGYKATTFKRMVNERGGYETACHLLQPGKIHDGFLRLLDLNALDISVEALVLQPEWRPLFTPAQLTEAQRRLKR